MSDFIDRFNGLEAERVGPPAYHKIARAIGAAAAVVAIPIEIKGIWTHDWFDIVFGAASFINGAGFALRETAIIQQLHEETTASSE